jgi:hypothetical protein
MRAIFPIHLILLVCVTVIALGEKYKLLNTAINIETKNSQLYGCQYNDNKSQNQLPKWRVHCEKCSVL